DPVSGDLFFVGINTQKVYRVRYPSGNHNPVITSATLAPPYGLTPLLVTVTASATDTDGDPLSYRWDWGNGAFATSASTTYTYTTNGVYNATLTVTDGRGGSDI